ncbi:MAG: hypothetical protein IPJ10_01935 [Flavobacteriales bacterium]|nr:hypothetical protein [Flavobacteriales bacterium]
MAGNPAFVKPVNNSTVPTAHEQGEGPPPWSGHGYGAFQHDQRAQHAAGHQYAVVRSGTDQSKIPPHADPAPGDASQQGQGDEGQGQQTQ